MSPFAKRLVDESLHRPTESFKRRQGKQIRGAMVRICYEMAGGRGDIPTAIADAIEHLHAGSLVIDDIQDESQFRRGEPALHRLIGVPLAINAGNWMYFSAIDLLSSADLPVTQRSQLVAAMVRAGRRCHEGQAIDLHARVDQIPARYWREVTEATSSLKTGGLVELAAQLGCIAAGAPGAVHTALASFGAQIGVALQMRNDLEELCRIAACRMPSDPQGPVRDDDLRHARITWPWVWAFELYPESGCRQLLPRLGRSATDHQALAVELLEITQKHGDQAISAIVQEQLRLLGEHILDPTLLQQMRVHLQLIEGDKRQPEATDRPAGIPGVALHTPVGARR
jgi:geranylgeranyl pyrophosphate synthase